MTIQHAVSDFLKWKSSYVSNVKSYRAAFKPFVAIYGKTELEDFSPMDFSNLTKKLGMRYSKAYVYYIVTLLKMFARYSFYAGYKTISPELIKLRRPITVKPYATREDVEDMCEFCDESNFTGLRNVCILSMLFESGARLSELLSLELHDLDGQQNMALITTAKNNLPRYLMWSKETHRKLQGYLGMRVSKDYRTSKLFLNKNGSPLTSRGVQYMLGILRKEAGILKLITPHSLRHGCAHEKAGKGANVKEIGVILGHSPNNPQSAMHYLRFDSKESVAILKKYL